MTTGTDMEKPKKLEKCGTLQDYLDLFAKLKSGMCPPTYRAYHTANKNERFGHAIIVKIFKKENICKVSYTSISNPYDVWNSDFKLNIPYR